VLLIQDLKIKYSNSPKWCIDGFSLNARPGELIIIAGGSGSGKSTLANTIIRLIPIFIRATIEGKIFIKNKNLNELSRLELLSHMGYVPQYPGDFTTSIVVEDEIVFPLENLQYKPEKIKSCLKDILNQLEINHLRNRLITELSSGEIQKVAIATALIHSPDLLILDEPMARIDSLSEIRIAEILRSIADKGKTLLIFEHRLDYLFPFADQVIYLSDGKITFKGKPKEIPVHDLEFDLPEVSEIIIPKNKQKIVNLNEAKSFLENIFEVS